jgi:hypothetical protein
MQTPSERLAATVSLAQLMMRHRKREKELELIKKLRRLSAEAMVIESVHARGGPDAWAYVERDYAKYLKEWHDLQGTTSDDVASLHRFEDLCLSVDLEPVVPRPRPIEGSQAAFEYDAYREFVNLSDMPLFNPTFTLP